MRSRPPRSGAGRVDSASTARLRRLVVQVAALGERRPRRREQTAVERRHPQIAGAAAGVREARDRAQRVPEPSAGCGRSAAVAQRLDAVALAVDRMPQRDEAARFGEQQEQDAIDDRERLLEACLSSG